MKEEWLFPGAMVPVDMETTTALVVEIKRLIDVVGGMALAQPEQEPVKDWIATHNDICALLRQAHDALALTSYPPQPKQEPVGYVSEGEPDRLIAQKQTKTPLRNYRLFTHDVPLYTTPHTKVGCVECGVSGGHAFYCVACSKELFGGYKKLTQRDKNDY